MITLRTEEPIMKDKFKYIRWLKCYNQINYNIKVQTTQCKGLITAYGFILRKFFVTNPRKEIKNIRSLNMKHGSVRGKIIYTY